MLCSSVYSFFVQFQIKFYLQIKLYLLDWIGLIVLGVVNRLDLKVFVG